MKINFTGEMFLTKFCLFHSELKKKSLNTTYELYIFFFYFEGRGTDGTKHGRFDPEDNGTHGTKGKHGKYKPSKNNYPNKYNGN